MGHPQWGRPLYLGIAARSGDAFAATACTEALASASLMPSDAGVRHWSQHPNSTRLKRSARIAPGAKASPVLSYPE